MGSTNIEFDWGEKTETSEGVQGSNTEMGGTAVRQMILDIDRNPDQLTLEV